MPTAPGVEVVMAALLMRLMRLDSGERAVLERFARPVLRNWNGVEVGQIRPSETVLPRPLD